MIGRHSTTTSPSMASSRRSTPWVEGCCGPMLRRSSSGLEGASSAAPISWPLVPGCAVESVSGLITAVHVARYGEVDRLRAERLAAPERKALPVIRQHDAAQEGVAIEADAEEVEELALVEVGARQAGGQAGRLGVRAGLEAQPGVLVH